MIGIEITAERKSNLEYRYTVLYGLNDTNFPKNRNGVPIVGRDDTSCDSLVEKIAEDIGNQRYNLIIGTGMKVDDKERIRKYITQIRKKH